MENLVYLFSCFLSCVIIARLMFQFMGDRYGKAFENPWIYRIAAVAAVVIITIVNLKRSAWWNATTNFLIYSFIVLFFYEDRGSGRNMEGLLKSSMMSANTSVPLRSCTGQA